MFWNQATGLTPTFPVAMAGINGALKNSSSIISMDGQSTTAGPFLKKALSHALARQEAQSYQIKAGCMAAYRKTHMLNASLVMSFT